MQIAASARHFFSPRKRGKKIGQAEVQGRASGQQHAAFQRVRDEHVTTGAVASRRTERRAAGDRRDTVRSAADTAARRRGRRRRRRTVRGRPQRRGRRSRAASGNRVTGAELLAASSGRRPELFRSITTVSRPTKRAPGHRRTSHGSVITLPRRAPLREQIRPRGARITHEQPNDIRSTRSGDTTIETRQCQSNGTARTRRPTAPKLDKLEVDCGFRRHPKKIKRDPETIRLKNKKKHWPSRAKATPVVVVRTELGRRTLAPQKQRDARNNVAEPCARTPASERREPNAASARCRAEEPRTGPLVERNRREHGACQPCRVPYEPLRRSPAAIARGDSSTGSHNPSPKP